MSIGTRDRQLHTRGASANNTRAATSTNSQDKGGLSATATDISFTNPDTIESAGSALPVFEVGTLIQVSGSVSNNRTFVVLTSAADTMTVEGSFVTTESAGNSIHVRAV